MDVSIGISYNHKIQAFQIGCSLSGCFYSIVFKMLRAVQLDNQICGFAEKVHDIVSDRALLPDFYGIGTEKIVPQVPLFLGHIFSELSGVF